MTTTTRNTTEHNPGDRFGRLTWTGQAERRPNRHLFWLVRCDCGTEKWVRRTTIVRGKTLSCGCLRVESNAARAGQAQPEQRKHQPGNRYGQLVLVERLEDRAHRGVFRCDCGTTKELQLGNITRGVTTSCADRAQHPDPRRAERPTYSGAHGRVRAARGPARDHPCAADCGRMAETWAYDHGDVDQLVEESGREAGYTYSAKPEHYMALCRQCHGRSWDASRAKAAPRHAVSLVHVALHAALGGMATSSPA